MANLQLDTAQLDEFDRRGYLLLEGAFTAAELDRLEADLPAITDRERARVVLDGASGTVRMVHGSHLTNDAFARLARHPRLVHPVEQLLGGPVYVYQSRLNLKEGLKSRPSQGYPWHQDFSTWNSRDLLPEPRAVVVFTFLDDVTACNAPLMVIPGSHRDGLLPEGESTTGTYREIAPDTLARLAAREGVAAGLGRRGTVLLMHCNLVHGSTENISPLRRALYSLVYSAADNRPASRERGEHYAAQDFTPVVALADDCLLP